MQTSSTGRSAFGLDATTPVLRVVLSGASLVDMGVRRLSISVPAQVEQQIRQAASAAGLSVSSWLAEVALHAATVQDGRRAVREFESEHGPLGEVSRAEARKSLDELGIIRPDGRLAG